MNLLKLLVALVIFFALCCGAYKVVQKKDIEYQGKKMKRLSREVEIYHYGMSILPEEQRNETLLAGVSVKFPSEDKKQLATMLCIEIKDKKEDPNN